MSGNPAPDWRDIFCGRSAQLEALERAYGDVWPRAAGPAWWWCSATAAWARPAWYKSFTAS